MNIIAPPATPHHNLFGHHGPLCQLCSGLGQVLPLGVYGRPTRFAAKCHDCNGTGVDRKQIQEREIASLLRRIDELELRWAKSLNRKTPRCSRQYWEELIAWATASGTAIANTTTETIVMPNITIPAGYMADGRCLHMKAAGGYGNTATPTLIFSLRWGGVAGTVLAKSTTVTTSSGIGGGASMTAMWSLEITIQVRSNGSSGTAMSNGWATLFTSTAATAGTVTHYGLVMPIASGSTGGTTPVAVTADFTADTALSLTATWGTANAANSLQGHQYTVESMN